MALDDLSYTSVSRTMRPPRVAVVVDGGEYWSYWTRRALFRAGQIWGGATFAIIPHQAGEVHPVLLQVCAAYDPDYVVTYSPSLADVEHFYPGTIPTVSNGAPLVGEKRNELLALAAATQVPLDADEAARAQIASVCSTYQTSEHVGWHEAMHLMTDEDGEYFPSVLDMPSTWSGSVLACPTDWGGELGVLVSSQAGIADAPNREAVEPSLAPETRDALTAWLLGNEGAMPPNELMWHPGTAVGANPNATPTAADRTMTHLEYLNGPERYRRTGLVVLGDAAEDFALARLWRLTFGEAHWLPSVLGLNEEKVPWPLALLPGRLARGLNRRSGSLVFSSLSLPDTEIDKIRSRMVQSSPLIAPTESDRSPISVVAAEALPWKRSATVMVAVRDQWDEVIAVPTTTADTGTRTMLTPLPPPILTHPDLAARPQMMWHTEVQFHASQSVRCRGLDSQDLFAQRPEIMPTWVRNSRHGVTYQSQRFDFVQAGIRPENRLARVALRDLSLTDWVSAKAAEHKLQIRPSDAGRRAALLTRMAGGRRQYTGLFGGPLLPALRAMLPSSPNTTTAYPDHQGIALSAAEGVLSLNGFHSYVDLPPEQIRDCVDEATTAGLLRRGLVLRCLICEHKQFITVDNLGQRWACQRCDATNNLNQWAWKAPDDEPIWFYDLHPVGRQLLRDHGDVPALVSEYLRERAKAERSEFTDVTELEFTRDDQPQAEIDLISYAGDSLAVVECKKTGNQLTGRAGRHEVRKKCQAAAWLRADEIIFATTGEDWTKSQTAIENAVRGYGSWTPLGPPTITFIARLGDHPSESPSLL